jgi:hypothetical protein
MWAKDDKSVVPGGERTEEGGSVTWEVVVRGYVIFITTGATFWRVYTAEKPGLITPHAFETALEAYQWIVDWLNGKSTWHFAWGAPPKWPNKEPTMPKDEKISERQTYVMRVEIITPPGMSEREAMEQILIGENAANTKAHVRFNFGTPVRKVE